MQNDCVELYPFRLYTNEFDLSKEYIDEILESFSNAFNIFTNSCGLQNPLKKGLYFQKGVKYIDITIKDIPIQRGLVSSSIENEAIQIKLHYNLIKGTATPIHELFHVFQYSYSHINNMWFMEGLARWSQNLTHKRKEKYEKLPSNIDELEILLYKKHESEYFWRKLFSLCGDDIEFIKIFLEDIEQYNDKITSKRSLLNNRYIFLSLIYTMEKLTIFYNDELKAFVKLLKSSVKKDIKDDYDSNTDTLIIDCLDCTNKTSKQIDSLNNIKHISGDLIISSKSVVNLNCFNNLKTIGGILNIIHNDNLLVINGFNSLESLKSLHIEGNKSLTTVNGFRTLFQDTKKISGYIKVIKNKKLTNINFMYGLVSIGSSFYLHNNNLKDLKGLEYLEKVGASFSISNNQLKDISQLKALEQINGMLNLLNNKLTTLNGLENLKVVKTTKWNGKNITISVANNKNLEDIEALKNVQTFDNYVILYFDKDNKYNNKPLPNSNFHKNILELYDFKTSTIIPTFKFVKKEHHDYKNFRKTTHNNLLTHMVDFELDADILVLSFVGFNGFLGGVFYNKYPLITNDINTNKIFIHDKKNSWYHSGIPNHTKNIEETIEFIKRLTESKKYKKIVCFGASMGAYMSLLIGKLLNVQKVVAFAPQTFLDKNNRELYNEDRWINSLDKLVTQTIKKEYLDLNLLYKLQDNNTTNVEIHYAKNVELDVKHLDHLENKSINKIGYDINSHYVSIYLRDTKQLDDIIKGALQYDER